MKNTLAQAIVTTFQSLISEIHTCLPGRVESYEYTSQKANIKPLISKKLLNNDVEELPVLTNIPIIFPRTKSHGITFPINKGDGVLIVFSERSLDRWYSSSGDVSEPGDPRKFDLSDSIAIPGLFSFNQENIASNNDDTEIHNSGQKVVIKKNGDIEVGSSSLKKLVNELFLTAFDSHTHLYAPGPGTPVPTAPPVPLSIPLTQLTSKVKAQ